jgi:translation initiation factor IF-2
LQLRDSIDEMNRNSAGAVIEVVEGGVGAITKTDIHSALAHGCPILCFRVRQPQKQEQEELQRFNVSTLYFLHFQHLLDEIAANIKQRSDSKERSGSASTAQQLQPQYESKTQSLQAS